MRTIHVVGRDPSKSIEWFIKENPDYHVVDIKYSSAYNADDYEVVYSCLVLFNTIESI